MLKRNTHKDLVKNLDKMTIQHVVSYHLKLKLSNRNSSIWCSSSDLLHHQLIMHKKQNMQWHWKYRDNVLARNLPWCFIIYIPLASLGKNLLQWYMVQKPSQKSRSATQRMNVFMSTAMVKNGWWATTEPWICHKKQTKYKQDKVA